MQMHKDRRCTVFHVTTIAQDANTPSLSLQLAHCAATEVRDPLTLKVTSGRAEEKMANHPNSNIQVLFKFFQNVIFEMKGLAIFAAHES